MSRSFVFPSFNKTESKVGAEPNFQVGGWLFFFGLINVNCHFSRRLFCLSLWFRLTSGLAPGRGCSLSEPAWPATELRPR